MVEFCNAHQSAILNIACLVIVSWIACLYGRNFYRPIGAKNSQLTACLTTIEKYRALDIRQCYNELDAVLCEDELIAPVWKKYRKTLVIFGDQGIDGVYSTVDASEYFYPAALVGKVNTKLWPGLAGVFTGIGILGTFLGLTLALLNINTSSTSALSASISNLLDGMGTAFGTSLIGMSFALVFGGAHPKRMHQFQENVEQLSDALDTIFERKNLEGIMLEQLAEIRQERTAIQQLSTDLAISICDHLPEVLGQMADRMDQAMQGNLNTMLEGLSSKLDEQTEKIEKVVQNTGTLANGFGNAINENAGEEAKALGSSLMKLSEEINALSNGVKEMIAQSQNTATKANEEMIEAVKQAVLNLDQNMGKVFKKQTANTDENIQRMTGFMEEMKDTMADIFAKMASSAREQAENNRKSMDTMKAANEENLGQINSTVKELMAQIATQMAAMQALVDEQQRGMDGTLQKMRSAVDSSSDVVESAGKVVVEFGSAAREAAGTIKDAAVPFTEAARPLKDAAASVDGSLKTLSAAMQLHSDTTAKVANDMKSMTEGQAQSAKEIQNSLEVAKKSWQAYEEKFEGVNTGMAQIFGTLQTGLSAYQAATSDGLQKSLKAFDGGFSNVVDQLASINAGTQETVKELQDSIDKLSESIKNTRK